MTFIILLVKHLRKKHFQMKPITLLSIILLSIPSFAQNNDTPKTRMINEIANRSTVIFEGKIVGKNKVFWGSGDNIYTSYRIEVAEVVLGNITKGTIEIIVPGGQLEKNGMGYDVEIRGIQCSGYSTFFCQPSSLSSGIAHTNKIPLSIVGHQCYDSNGKLPTPSSSGGDVDPYYVKDPFLNISEIYKELNKIKPITIPKEKKSPNVEEKGKTGQVPTNNPAIPYSQRLLNYADYFQLITAKAESNKTNASLSRLVNDLTLSFANPQITGTLPRYFEFDVLAQAKNSTTYFDNCLIRIQYNTSAFGSNVVANNKVTITKGTSFNSLTYIDPDANAIDQTSSAMGIPFGTSSSQSTWNRTLLTTTNQQLIHIKIEIQNCGQNTAIDFADQSFTPMFSFYSDAANAPITATLSYDNTFYQNPLNIVLCQVQINDFTSPVNGGVGDIIEITGLNFGATRGNGQVKFKNADDGGVTNFQKLDKNDYISWTDTLIQIKMPSRIDIVDTTRINTPGSGNFIVKNNSGDSAISNNNAFGQTFKVYYSIHNAILFSNKYHANLINKNNLGGYTIGLDTSMSNHPERMMCLTKAIKTWKCFTTVNWIIGNDTSVNTSYPDAITTIFFADNLSNFDFLGETIRNKTYCNTSTPFISTIRDFDIVIKNVSNWWYDTTGLAIPSGMYDFYEVITHELGHALGLEHIIDNTQIMYYATQSPGNPRRNLQPYTSDVEGGTEQVASSISTINLQCGFVDMDPASTGSCSNVGINELLENNFFITAYPNPTTDEDLNISFQSPTNLNAQIIIYDIVGKEIFREYVNNRQDVYYTHSLNISNLSSGLYFVNLIIDKNKASAKFIKN
jgi:hypothetical protein